MSPEDQSRNTEVTDSLSANSPIKTIINMSRTTIRTKKVKALYAESSWHFLRRRGVDEPVQSIPNWPSLSVARHAD